MVLASSPVRAARYPRIRTAAPYLALSLLSIPILFVGLTAAPIVNGDEAFYRYVSRHMVRSGNWLRLDFTGEHRIYDTFMNAPIHYWARAALIMLFGDNRFSMRILSASFGVLAVLLTCRITTHIGGRRAGWWAGLALLTTYQFVHLHSARTGEIDAILTCLVALAAWEFLRAVESGRGFVRSHLCLIAIANLKTPLLLPIIAAELLLLGCWPAARRRTLSWAVLLAIMLPLGLTWHIANAVSDPEGCRSVVQEMLGQADGAIVASQDPRTVNLSNADFYVRIVSFGAFPYALAFPFAALCAFFGSRGKSRRRLCVVAVFFAAAAAFFLAVTKRQPWYMLPAYPLIGICVGLWIEQLRRGRAGPVHWAAAAIAIGLSIALGAGALDCDPLGARATAQIPELKWRSLEMSQAMGLALGFVAVVIGVALVFARQLRIAHKRLLSIALIAALFGQGLLRTAAPLRRTPAPSSRELLAARIESDLAAGRAVRLPIPVTEPGMFVTRYYFGDRFGIRSLGPAGQPGPDGTRAYFMLEEKRPGNTFERRMNRPATRPSGGVRPKPGRKKAPAASRPARTAGG